ncbi:hypothetical protein KIPB_006821, partial [Kipferlia bialata]|eukprot:g6821.t1
MARQRGQQEGGEQGKEAAEALLGGTSIAAQGLDLIPHFCRFVGPKTLEINGQTVTADRIVVNTGCKPMIPGIEGLADTPFMTSTDILRRRDRTNKLVVLGGGFIACELAHWQAAAGVEVTQMVRSKIVKHCDEEIRDEFIKMYTKHITVMEHTVPSKVTFSEDTKLFSLTMPSGEVMECDGLLVATGVVPATKGLGVETAGLETNRQGYIVADKYFRTNVEGVYSVGDINGQALFRHAANYQQASVMAQFASGVSWANADKECPALGLDRALNPCPAAVFSYPTIAYAGLNERDITVPYVKHVQWFKNTGKAAALLPETGFVKLLVSTETKAIIGIHLIGQ